MVIVNEINISAKESAFVTTH